MCGACACPAPPGTRPGRIVSNVHEPSAPVGSRPKPQNPAGVRMILRLGRANISALGVGLPQLDQGVRQRRAVAVKDANLQADPDAGRVRSYQAAERRLVGQAKVKEWSDGL